MSFFKQLLGGNAAENAKTLNDVNWIPLTDVAEFSELVAASKTQKTLL